MPDKLLVADDDERLRKVLKRFLTDSGFTVVMTDNGSDALLLARESRPDLLLVDADMPGLDGHALCRVLKKEAADRQMPVIIMSGSLTAERDVVGGLEGGADDYVVKPFSLQVLLARLRAVLRRYETTAGMDRALRKAGIELDPAGRTVRVRRKPVPLTRKEFDLLATLLAKAGRILSIPYLLETVWGYDPADYNDPGTVEVHVSHLRKKLGSRLGALIVNVQGHGYKFEG